ncbi:RluA family pseudouridine synthase [Dendrosporobacter sp. 1207_IL3150]|uniref:RluA family pseudouridine synthase n=1 Tax=Dendrosporobacter sp. 1207_IL3150 TaxID=3084054 RepID=UPI002FDB1DF4
MKSFSTYIISEEHNGFTVENYLKQVLQCSGRKIQKLTRLKGIRLNGKPVFLQRTLKSGSSLQVMNLEDTSYGVIPEPGNVDILYEDSYMLILNKPARQLVHPTGQTQSGTLANHLAYFLQNRGTLTTIRAIHRLDRDTSGCVIFAKDSKSQSILEQQLKSNTLKRTYIALVKSFITPPSGIIDAPIGPHPTMPNRRAVAENGEPAVTHYKTIRTLNEASLLELQLDTGRTHQIRLHLAYQDCPIIGDGMYGVRSPAISRQALHASAVTFNNLKDHGEITIEAPLPPDFINALSKL